MLHTCMGNIIKGVIWGYLEVDSRSKPKSVPCLTLCGEVSELSQIPFDSVCLKLVVCCLDLFWIPLQIAKKLLRLVQVSPSHSSLDLKIL